ncbi:MAG: hypothetical protein QNK03_15910, partial [Myxococcota bacterium]|nr:hypothetical protein [Myxococcota bacterium]
LAGRFAEAEKSRREYFKVGLRIGDANASHSWVAHESLQRSECGGLGELLPIVREGCSRYPTMAAYRAGLAWTLARLGRTSEVERQLDCLTNGAEPAVAQRIDWPFAMAAMTEACVLTANQQVAAEIRELLRPLAGRLVVVGLGVAIWGPFDRYIGLLSATLGDWEDAAASFESAISLCREIGAFPWLGRTQLDYARMLIERAEAGDAARAAGLVASCESVAEELGMTVLSRECRSASTALRT